MCTFDILHQESTEKSYVETEVANLISFVGNMITCKSGSDFEEGYKQLVKDRTISDRLTSHIMAVILSNRYKYE